MTSPSFPWPSALRPGRLVRRYERFLVDVRLDDGDDVRAHCVNPGRMEGLVVPGARVWLSTSPNAARSLPLTWELIELEGRLIGANTGLPNRLVQRLLETGAVTGLDDATEVRPEQAFGRGHRVDFVLRRPSGPHLVEVKNCHLVYPDGYGYFPDSVSERAVAHVDALARVVKRGGRATVCFTVLRSDAQGVRPSALHAPEFAQSVWRAARLGVTFRALRFVPSLEGLTFDTELPVDVKPYDPAPLKPWAQAYEATTGWVRKDGRVAGQALR